MLFRVCVLCRIPYCLVCFPRLGKRELSFFLLSVTRNCFCFKEIPLPTGCLGKAALFHRGTTITIFSRKIHGVLT